MPGLKTVKIIVTCSLICSSLLSNFIYHKAQLLPWWSWKLYIFNERSCHESPFFYIYSSSGKYRVSSLSVHFFKSLKVTESPACLGELFILRRVVSIVYLHIISLFRSRNLLTNQLVACSDSGPNCWIVYIRGRLSWWVFSAQTLVRSKRVLT